MIRTAPSATTTSLRLTWQQPTFLLPLFCLCSLLGSTDSLAAALGMAVVIILASISCNILVALLSTWIPAYISTALWLLCGATIMTLIELLLHASFYELYRQLGLFLPLSLISCLLLARPEMQVHRQSLRISLQRALSMSGGYALAALVLGAGRELVGHGSLFANAATMLGSWARPLELQVFRADMGFLLAVLAPGAFVALGLGVALYNWLGLHLHKSKSNKSSIDAA
ncbi:MAG: Rnf-Nqr domain containing protein [Steroidobacteraceae bacterium]